MRASRLLQHHGASFRTRADYAVTEFHLDGMATGCCDAQCCKDGAAFRSMVSHLHREETVADCTLTRQIATALATQATYDSTPSAADAAGAIAKIPYTRC